MKLPGYPTPASTALLNSWNPVDLKVIKCHVSQIELCCCREIWPPHLGGWIIGYPARFWPTLAYYGVDGAASTSRRWWFDLDGYVPRGRIRLVAFLKSFGGIKPNSERTLSKRVRISLSVSLRHAPVTSCGQKELDTVGYKRA
ncbi:uncharacterized protein YALI1_A18470g [Yarrowia lipolytica]|uniref:Uncharacterized protein n=1 Tax=Yarrowia lipolytica TaxID=4952 RepID=A0A1D8N5A1_YARLL|nr:hypothetical protein YALI1_A18470g [Yarrowia lipolytica]